MLSRIGGHVLATLLRQGLHRACFNGLLILALASGAQG